MTELPETSKPHSKRSPEPQASILLGDGNPASLLELREALEDLGQNLVEVSSAEEAVRQVESGEFAAILLDVPTLGMDGFATARAIRANKTSQHTPIIFLVAGDIARSQLEEGYALGVVDFLVKPILSVALKAKVRGFVLMFQDQRRTKQEADQLRLLIQGTTDYAIFMLDPEGTILTWNAGAERFKGYQAAEIIGQHFSRFYPPDAIERGWPAHELKVAAAEGRFEDEGWRIRKDGTRFWANVVLTALRDGEGHLRGFSKVTRDLTARQQAEESLWRSEERFRLLVEGAIDYAIFLLDPQGYVATWNAGAERIKGYQAEEIFGQHFSKFYPQEAIDRGWPDHELQVAAAVGRFEDEGWRVRKDGRQFWANVVITALRDEHGQLRGFSKITRDLTERRRSEEAARRLVEEAAARRVAEENSRLIQEQRERLRVTLASIGDAVISTDAQGRVNFLNPVAQELVGWKNEEATNRPLTDVFHIINENTRQPVENPAVRALKEGVIVGLTNHTLLIGKDGTERPIDDSAAPIRDAEGTIIGSVLVFRDITERKKAEESLRHAEWRFRTMADNSPVLIWQTDSSGVMFVNRHYVAFFGQPYETMAGMGWAAFLHPDDSGYLEAYQSAFERRSRYEYQTRFRRYDGEYRWLQNVGTPHYGSDGAFFGFIGCSVDVTEIKQASEALADSDRRKDEFLSILAHELRNPLAPIRNGLQLMKLAKTDAQAIEQARIMMERQVGQMVHLIDDLMDLTRISQGKIALQKARMPISAAVRNAVETSRPLIEAAGHELILDMPEETIYVDADETRLSQVFANLLNNSAKYTENGGRIRINVDQQEHEVVIAVEDNGVGIPAHMLPRVFDMFTQVDRSLEKSQGGLGIGLSIVKRLIVMHGGSIAAESGGHGTGSRFLVRLPVVLSLVAEVPVPESGEVVKPSARRRILVADDNRDSANSLSMLLRVMGNETQTAYDGLEAVGLAAVFRPDVVLLDIGMPTLNGLDACRRIREQPWSVNAVLVACTGWGQKDDKRLSKEAGFDFHMVKPIDPAALEKLLSDLQSTTG